MVKVFSTLTLALCLPSVIVYADSGNQDCQVTLWGPWQPCDPYTHTQTRYRQVQVSPEGTGLACPVLVDENECTPNSMVLQGIEVNEVTPALAIPTSNDQAGPRADAIAKAAALISNVPRDLVIGHAVIPYFVGPAMGKPGSLVDQIGALEVMRLMQFQPSPQMAGALSQLTSTPFTSMQAIANAYSVAPTIGLEVPMSTDNSDATFGLQRITCKSFVLRVVRRHKDKNLSFSITNAQVTQRCGADLNNLVNNQKLFVEDFSSIGQWNDLTHPEKYVPNSIAFYCYNQGLHELLPIEIRLLDSKMTYTPFDSVADWTLAKMAVEAASNTYHSVYHMVATHGTMIPTRVEMIRTMAANHPVRALLERHSQVDIGLERLATTLLYNTTTPLDMTYGTGAAGAIRFMGAVGKSGLSFRNTFKQDVKNRGLDRLGEDHTYVQYASQYWSIIEKFVGRYVDAYYTSDKDVINDFELQHWAQACAKIPQLRDFPLYIPYKSHLRDLIVHLIFTNTITHHGMNGAVSWQGMAAPYSPTALWKPLPKVKNSAVNLMEYTTPLPLLPIYVGLVGYFARPVPPTEGFMNAYTVSPFKDEHALTDAIKDFNNDLQRLEALITKKEQGKKWPFTVLKPSRTSYHSWI